MSYRTKKKILLYGEIILNILAVIIFIYCTMLMMWKLHYPTCIPGYAPEMFRLLDEAACDYTW